MSNKRTISFKIPEKEYKALERLAQNEQVSLSNFCERIAISYIHFFKDFKRHRLVAYPRPIITSIFDGLDDNNINDIINTSHLAAMNLLKTELPEITYDGVTQHIDRWFDDNNITLHYHYEVNGINGLNKYSCRHGLGTKWAKVMSGVVCNLLKEVNCTITKTHYDEHLFQIEFKQNKK